MKAIDNNDIDVDDFYENAPILESLRDGLLLAKQVAGVEVGLVLAHLRIRRMNRVRMKTMMRMWMRRRRMRMKRMVTGLVLAHLRISRISRVRMKRMIRG